MNQESKGPSRRVLIAAAITGSQPCPGQVGVLDGAACRQPTEAHQTHGVAAQPGCATPPAATYPAFGDVLHDLDPTAWEAAGLGVVRPCSGGVTALPPVPTNPYYGTYSFIMLRQLT